MEALRAPLEQLEHEDVRGGSPGAVYEPAKPHLSSMPVEIILKICSYLDADFLKNILAKVCTRFETILEDNHIWKYWYHSKLDGGAYPPVPNLRHWEEEPVDWPTLCAESAREKRRWENVGETMKHIVVKDIHFASVDTVCLINNGEYCISGGRDRGMALWRVADIAPAAAAPAPAPAPAPAHAPDECAAAAAAAAAAHATLAVAQPRHIRHGAHEGWVWDLAADCERNTRFVYSASWDNSVKLWDVERDFTAVLAFRCGMSALCVDTCDELVLAGLYSKRVVAFDARAGAAPVGQYKPHRGPVLALATRGPLVASVSEDRTLSVWDARARRPLAAAVPLARGSGAGAGAAYPASLSWAAAALYVGDSKGRLTLLHPERFTVVAAHEVWRQPPSTMPAAKITGCLQTAAGLILASDRGEIKFLHNSLPPREYVSTRTASRDVTQMRYLNGILVVGSCDSALEFWIPAERYDAAVSAEDSSSDAAVPAEDSSPDAAVPAEDSSSDAAVATEQPPE